MFKTKFPQGFDPSFIFVQYFTHNQSYTPNCDYDLKYLRIYYNAMLHVNIKMTSQQRWYLLSCFSNKINFLFSCEIRSWSLRFRQLDIIMSSKYRTKQYISAQYCAKQLSEIWCKNIQAFLRYSNFRVGIFLFCLTLYILLLTIQH